MYVHKINRAKNALPALVVAHGPPSSAAMTSKAIEF
jgi:hypothetical protein